jgi:hypothetical protein
MLHVVGEKSPHVVSAVESPSLEQLQVLNDKLADKLELLTSGVTTKEKIMSVKDELRQMGVKPTQTIIGEYMFRSREAIGRSYKEC